jgi:hypothetical protein
MVLTAEAESDRADFHREFGSGNCSCFISPPCLSCTHPGNPINQEENEWCWEPEDFSARIEHRLEQARRAIHQTIDRIKS